MTNHSFHSGCKLVCDYADGGKHFALVGGTAGYEEDGNHHKEYGSYLEPYETFRKTAEAVADSATVKFERKELWFTTAYGDLIAVCSDNKQLGYWDGWNNVWVDTRVQK